MMKLKVKDPSEIQSLLDAEKYKKHIEEGGHWIFPYQVGPKVKDMRNAAQHRICFA